MEEPKKESTEKSAEDKGDAKDIAIGSGQMDVKVYSPFKTYYDGEAQSVSASSATGPFDVLGRHHNFITLLVPCDIVIRTPSGDETIAVDGGIMHVKADKVIVFLDV